MAQSFSFRRRAQSFRYAFRGVAHVVRSQHNAWIHAGATVAVVLGAVILQVSAFEWTVLVLAIAGVWSTEALNTAIEAIGDALSLERHPMIGLAKDAAAGAVLLAAIGAMLVGIFIFGPRLLRILGCCT
nr:diacylglycerol kinase family protein [Gammaproteobacteria bacterium]